MAIFGKKKWLAVPRSKGHGAKGRGKAMGRASDAKHFVKMEEIRQTKSKLQTMKAFKPHLFK